MSDSQPHELVFHIDINSCYASCEKIFDPAIAEKPVLVLSNNDGCVIALDSAAKNLGFRMGEPWFKIRDRAAQTGVVVRSSNYELYGDISDRVMQLLTEYAESFEQYSIDEAFLTITCTPAQAHTIAERIKTEIHRFIGVPVCVGVARTKTLAKLANKTAKKTAALAGVCVWENLPEQQRKQLCTQLPAAEVWGIGRRLAKRLLLLQIHTVHDLMHANPGIIRQKFNVVIARTVLELNGIKAINVASGDTARDQLMYSRSFSEPVTARETMREVLSVYTQRAVTRLVSQQQAAQSVLAFCATGRFSGTKYTAARSHVHLIAPTTDPAVLTRAAMQLLNKANFDGPRYARAGVAFTGLSVPGAKDDLLDLADTTQTNETLAQLLYEIKSQHGERAIGCGVAGLAQPARWEMRRELLSRRATTHWDELPIATI